MIVFLRDSDRDRNKEEDEAGDMNEVTEEAADDDAMMQDDTG